MLLVSALLGLSAFTLTQSLSLPPPRGPYNVGSKELVLPHVTPNDPAPPNNVGESLLVTVYYPTHDAAPLIPYIWAGLAGFYEDYFNLTHGSFGNTTANIAFNATPADGPELPTLLFQPACAGPPSQLFLGLIADSVSNGYVVVAVDHPYEQPYIQFPNGTEIYGHGVNWPEEPSLYSVVHAIRLTDASAVLDMLPTIASITQVPINLTHFIPLGHSLGGSAAVSQPLVEENRTASSNKTFLGAIDIDGTIFEPAYNASADTALDNHIPNLLLASSLNVFGEGYDQSWPRFVSAQKKWRKSLRIEGNSNHTDFSDLIFLKQAYGKAGGEGAITAARFLEISRLIVGDFLAFLVTAVGKEGILSGTEAVRQSFPEVAYDFNGTGIL